MSPHKSLDDFFACYSPNRDDRLAGCWRSPQQWLLVPMRPCDGRGHIPKCSRCSGPQQRQAHRGFTSASPWRRGDRLAAAQAHTFRGQQCGVSPRRLACLKEVVDHVPLPPWNHSFLRLCSLQQVASAAQDAPPSSSSQTLLVLAVVPLWGLPGTVVRCCIGRSCPGRT